ncbi:hypothetical protein TVAG_139850 [Trichomonas vaginalis G3]|uniref:Uncharacterized protein n=1 Tax=Trichomonas vaginalis (strain ATCC PRA-98 / G3) TaxID=412133 RepID=A2EJ52_TRIV3|nr:hypothetical protein TVAGG3_0610010 [Trichomonas vaginalis G3]EAY07355.1 hypothetical protein TVAG_139850 [Trichomonas vaginalis G3]KAI5524527.1 hypothetical protein TVAGG3_0610010 [Trichomonas vaginalis G3]|eukprot:XP_001319578.1 hypothetical protein [Trichomonas vaginalis G3]
MQQDLGETKVLKGANLRIEVPGFADLKGDEMEFSFFNFNFPSTKAPSIKAYFVDDPSRELEDTKGFKLSSISKRFMPQQTPSFLPAVMAFTRQRTYSPSPDTQFPFHEPSLFDDNNKIYQEVCTDNTGISLLDQIK